MRSTRTLERGSLLVAKAFGATLKACLKLPGKGAAPTARRAKIARPYIHRLAKGESQPSLTVFLRIVEALEMEDAEFLKLLRTNLKAIEAMEANAAVEE